MDEILIIDSLGDLSGEIRVQDLIRLVNGNVKISDVWSFSNRKIADWEAELSRPVESCARII